MVVQTDVCAEGLTEACFRERPEEARKVFAYRLLGALVGPDRLRRMQTFKGVPLPIGLAAEMGAGITDAAATGATGAVPPVLGLVWEGGPPHITQAEEGEIIMPTIRRAKINFSGAETSEIVAAVAGQKISVCNIALTVGGETDLTWKSAATAISGAMALGGTNEPRGMTHGLGDYPLQTTAGEALNLTSGTAVQVSGYITYYLE